MLKDIWQEIIELTKDRKFNRNAVLLIMISLISSWSLAFVGNNPGRLAQQEKLERFSNIMSVGISIRAQTIIRK